MTRLAVFVLPLVCAACLIVGADEKKKDVPATPDPPAKKVAQPAKVVQQVRLAVQLGGFGGKLGTPAADRADVEPTDNTERFVLLSPRGPIVVEAKITLDGQPFRVAREKLVDEMIAAGDSNGDGKSTWKEAVNNPKFMFGRANFQMVVPLMVPGQNNNQKQPNKQRADEKDKPDAKPDKLDDKKDDKQDDKKPAAINNAPPVQVQVKVLQLGTQNQDQKDELIKYFDANKNGLVDRSEARSMLARTSGGPTFSVLSTYNRSRQPDVKSVLDKNNDGTLSKDELELASDSLQSRDANGNDLLEPVELGGNGVVRHARGGQVVFVQAFSSVQNRQAVGHLLGPTANYATIFQAMKKKYGEEEGAIRARSFSHFPEMFAQLDANANGELDQSEVAALEQTKPHIQLLASVGSGGKQKSGGVIIRSIAKELENQDSLKDELSKEVIVHLSDAKLHFVAADSRQFNYSQTSKRMIDRYDTNKNGYIEEKEMEKVNVGLKQQFKRWDLDSDGKVYAEEVTEFNRRQQAPVLSRVTTQVGEKGPSLFGVLDQSGDQRLSLREMKTAAKQLMSKDQNGDGQLGLDEMPVEIHVSFGQGNGNLASLAVTRTIQNSRAKGQPKKDKGPPWFTRLDRNGDGDVTLREFVGSEEQFKKIDTNGDGFIELKEAFALDVQAGKSDE